MKHKICIYAIARNEEQFVDRFCDAAAEADYIAVLDTGSTDRTVEKLSDRGVIVRQTTIEPWRFDVARNLSMLLIPRDTDLCVCVDLDEVLLPGWRAALEKAWTVDAETGTYRCICSRNADGSEGTVFLREKIHRLKCATWRYPVHEVLVPSDGRPFFRCVNVEGMAAEHLPDERKSRAQYLPLLELAAQETPQDARCAHYLGREYLYRGMFQKAAEELKRHLTLPSAVWDEERAASMRYLSACMHALGDERSAMCWAMRAIAEGRLPRGKLGGRRLLRTEGAAHHHEEPERHQRGGGMGRGPVGPPLDRTVAHGRHPRRGGGGKHGSLAVPKRADRSESAAIPRKAGRSMKIKEAIRRTDLAKPNAFEEELKFLWLTALEGQIAADVFLMAPAETEQFDYSYPAGLDMELLVKPPYDELYVLYLEAKIDAENGEYNKYQNSLQLYNNAYGNFLRWFAGTYDPVQGYKKEA